MERRCPRRTRRLFSTAKEAVARRRLRSWPSRWDSTSKTMGHPPTEMDIDFNSPKLTFLFVHLLLFELQSLIDVCVEQYL